MLSRMKLAAKVALGMRRGRDVTVLPDDIFVVSYPRSGNTWTRFLIGNLESDCEPITFDNIERKVLDIYTKTDFQLLKVPSPRIMKSHEYFDPRYKKVIYIVRDPRDVAVSYYYYHMKMRKIDEHYPIDEYASNFICGRLSYYGSWGENVGSWLGARQDDKLFLLIKYEDMVENLAKELRRIVLFLGITVTEKRLREIMKLSSFIHMKQLEKRECNTWERIKKSRKDIFFVRSGKPGEWKSKLSDRSAAKIVAAWGKLMNHLGYLAR